MRRRAGANAITIEASGNLNLNTSLDTSGALTLEAGAGAGTGAINFDDEKATTLQGAAVSIASDMDAADDAASNQDVVIRAAGDVTLDHQRINLGTGALTVEAGNDAMGTGSITFTSAEAITAAATLIQDGDAFAATKPAGLDADIGWHGSGDAAGYLYGDDVAGGAELGFASLW